MNFPEYVAVESTLLGAQSVQMTSGKKHLEPLRRRIRSLSHAERRDMCWEVGHFEARMLVKQPGETPTKPYMLVCIDPASRAVMGCDLLRETPSPQDLLALLVASMENPRVEIGTPVVPNSLHLDDTTAFKLLRSELGQLVVKVELAERLSVFREFREITEPEFFSWQVGYMGRKN